MARPQSIDEDTLISRLAGVFRDVGYEGASLALLSEATGLQKASLYHRFPGGKRQMAEEVLAAALSWLTDNVLAPLRGEGPPGARLDLVVGRLDDFYSGGRKACLLNMLASPRAEDGPFTPAIKRAFEALIEAFASLARDAGHTSKEARRRAERAVMLLQGSLVLARGLQSPAPFLAFLRGLPDELVLASPASGGNP
jgi:TetR/AcrR family transcriptional repressor of lmrAB and yxaGH operons